MTCVAGPAAGVRCYPLGAVVEIAKIVNYRFDDLVADANPIAAARVARFEQLNR